MPSYRRYCATCRGTTTWVLRSNGFVNYYLCTGCGRQEG